MAAVSSAVRICCRAFEAIEHRGFGDFGDGTAEAETAQLHYHEARRFVLTAAPWGFAMQYAQAAGALEAPAPPETPHVIQMPREALFFREIVDAPLGYKAFAFGDHRIRTDVSPPFTYSFTEDVEEATRFSPGFVEALMLYLAAQFAPKYTRSQNRAEILMRRFEAVLDLACATDARQGPPQDARGWWTEGV